MRKASGRGKSRKAGGLVTMELPSQDHASSTAEVCLMLCSYCYCICCKSIKEGKEKLIIIAALLFGGYTMFQIVGVKYTPIGRI